MHNSPEVGRLAVPVLTLFLTSIVAAEVPEEGVATNTLPPIVVQASRLEKSTLEMPALVQVVDSAAIAAAGCSTTAELLERKCGVFIRSLNSTPALAQVALRGFGDNSFGRVLIMVNGERLNNPDMAAPNLLRVPLESIARVEVIRGPQSVLQGDYATAGVINIITDDTTIEPKSTVGAAVGAHDTYSGFVNTTGAFVEEGVSYRGSLDWVKSGGYRDNSDYEAWQVNGAVRQDFSERRYLSLSSFYHFAEYGLPGALSREEYRQRRRRSESPRDSSELESFGLNLGGRVNVGDYGYVENRATVSRRKSDSSWHGIAYGAPWDMLYNGAVDSYALLPQYVLDWERQRVRNVVTLGSDLRWDRSDFLSNYRSVGYSSLTRWDYDRATFGGYAQDEFFVTEELSFLVGGRMEWFENRVRGAGVAGRGAFGTREHALEGGVLYRATDSSKFYAKAGRVYHAPFIDEIFAGVGAPNLGLRSESGYNFELGSEVELGSEWHLMAAVYDMELEREIYYDPLHYQNLNSPGDTRRLGLDIGVGWSRAEVGSVTLNYSAVQSEFTGGPYDGKRVPLVPQHTLSLNGEYTVGYRVSLLAGVRYVARQDLGSDFNNEAERVKAYALFDCGVRYEPQFLDGLRLTLTVDNVLGERYSDYAGWSADGGSYYYPARERFWKLGATYTF